jgi:hypothetical protein
MRHRARAALLVVDGIDQRASQSGRLSTVYDRYPKERG